MKFYFAPLEGVTGYIYRNTYNKFFGEEIDKYFTPVSYTHLDVYKRQHLNLIVGILIQHHCKPGQQLES